METTECHSEETKKRVELRGWRIVPFLLTGKRRGMPAMRDLAMWHWAWRRARSSSRDKHIIIITCHVSQITITLYLSLLTQLTLFLWELCIDLPSVGHLHNRSLEPAVCTYMSNGTHTLRCGEQLPECARPILALSIRTRADTSVLGCAGITM